MTVRLQNIDLAPQQYYLKSYRHFPRRTIVNYYSSNVHALHKYNYVIKIIENILISVRQIIICIANFETYIQKYFSLFVNKLNNKKNQFLR